MPEILLPVCVRFPPAEAPPGRSRIQLPEAIVNCGGPLEPPEPPPQPQKDRINPATISPLRRPKIGLGRAILSVAGQLLRMRVYYIQNPFSFLIFLSLSLGG